MIPGRWPSWHKRTDLLGHVPADNGAGTFLSPAPNHKRPDLSEHVPADNGAGTFLSPAPNPNVDWKVHAPFLPSPAPKGRESLPMPEQ
jgi:hypothetical protein